MNLEDASAKWRSFCLCLDVLIVGSDSLWEQHIMEFISHYAQALAYVIPKVNILSDSSVSNSII